MHVHPPTHAHRILSVSPWISLIHPLKKNDPNTSRIHAPSTIHHPPCVTPSQSLPLESPPRPTTTPLQIPGASSNNQPLTPLPINTQHLNSQAATRRPPSPRLPLLRCCDDAAICGDRVATTTNDERRTTNGERRTTNDEPRTNERRCCCDEYRTATMVTVTNVGWRLSIVGCRTNVAVDTATTATVIVNVH